MDRATLRSHFDVTGYFYVEPTHSYPCRKFLNIKIKDKDQDIPEEPDLMVVMMNPGASVPLAGGDDGRREVPAAPDDTQDRIMKVMLAKGFKYARVLNLSDFRDQNSNTFKPMISTLDANFPEHTIFHSSRSAEFTLLFNSTVKVIVGWGCDDKLARLASLAMTKLDTSHIVGVQNTKYTTWLAYYHPSRKGGWHADILAQL
jgi:uncharacterized protein DUF1643